MQHFNDPYHLSTGPYRLTNPQAYDAQEALDLTDSDSLQYNPMFKFQNAAQMSISGPPLQMNQQTFNQNQLANNDPDGQQRMAGQPGFSYPPPGFRPVTIPMNQQTMASNPYMSQRHPQQHLHLQSKLDSDHNVSDQYNSFHTMSAADDMVASLTQASQSVPSMYDNVDIHSLVNSPAMSVVDLPSTSLPPLTANQLDSPPNSNLTPSPSNEADIKEKGFGDRTQWTADEDNLLRLAVQLYGPNTEKWSKIAACVPGRTNKNCRKRWFHSLDPSLRKGPWTEEEDRLLREGVARYPKQWSKIADMIKGRTDDQCAKRWRESLDPNIDRSSWTEDDDKLLLEKYEKFGTQWQKIALFFPGRPGLHCRNRWRKLQRNAQAKAGAYMPEPRRGDSGVNKSSPATEHERMSPQRSLESNSSSPIVPTIGNATTSKALPPTSDPSVLAQFHDPTAEALAGDLRAQHQDHDLSQAPRMDEVRREMLEEMNPYGCDVPGCYASFSASSGLFYHMKGAHANLEGISKPYRCAIPGCTKKYKNINGLQYHIRDAKGSSGHAPAIVREDGTLESPVSDSRPYKCQMPRCKKAYRTPNGLNYHVQHGHGQPDLFPNAAIGDVESTTATGKRRRGSGQKGNNSQGPPHPQQQLQQPPGSNLHLMMGSPQQALAQFPGQAMASMSGVNMNAMRSAPPQNMMSMPAQAQSPQLSLQRMQLPGSASSSPAQQHATLNNANPRLLAGMMNVNEQGRYGDTRIFKCPQINCGQAFTNLNGLQLHQRQHGQIQQQHYQQPPMPYPYQSSPHQSPHQSPQLQHQNMMFSPHLGFASVPFPGPQPGSNLQDSPHLNHNR